MAVSGPAGGNEGRGAGDTAAPGSRADTVADRVFVGGGELAAESRVGEGSTFTLTLPRA